MEVLDEVGEEVGDEARDVLEDVDEGKGLDVVGRRVVLVLDGIGGLDVGLGVKDGRGEPPLVGVLTWLPSQYIVKPPSANSFNTVLIPLVPGPLQYTEFACPWLSGLGYSI